jgi:stearoyl-CoA desaturase (delta-9 desaturase)
MRLESLGDMGTTASQARTWRYLPRSSIPFALFHFVPVLALVTGVSRRAIVLLVVLYVTRMLAISVGYHRYFSHRTYKLSRPAQFLVGFWGTTAVQRGPIWWAKHHRDHHKYADTDRDPHSPMHGFWWSHIGWVLSGEYSRPDFKGVEDLTVYPELVFIDRHDWIGPWTLAVACFLIGGWSGLVIGFFGSTVLVWHATFSINSLTHLVGRRRYATPDTSRNSAVIALFTGGEGWHNNHHYWPASARQGFYWWEFDPTYYALKLLSVVGLVRDLRAPSRNVRELGRIDRGSFDIGMFRAYRAKALARLGAAREKAAALVARARSHGDAGADAEQAALVAKLHAEHEALEALIASSLQSAEELARLTKRARTRALA